MELFQSIISHGPSLRGIDISRPENIAVDFVRLRIDGDIRLGAGRADEGDLHGFHIR